MGSRTVGPGCHGGRRTSRGAAPSGLTLWSRGTASRVGGPGPREDGACLPACLTTSFRVQVVPPVALDGERTRGIGVSASLAARLPGWAGFPGRATRSTAGRQLAVVVGLNCLFTKLRGVTGKDEPSS